MVSNVEPTVPEQPRLLGPCQSVAAGSSGRTTLVELGAPSGGGGGPVSGAMSLGHIWEGVREVIWVSRDLGNANSVSAYFW